MKVRMFRPSDAVSVQKWLTAQNLKTEVPSNGFIVPGVCAGFLMQNKGTSAVIEGLVTNPLVSSETRHKALDALVTEICNAAADLGYKRIYAWSSNEGTLKRSLRHGFAMTSNILIKKDL